MGVAGRLVLGVTLLLVVLVLHVSAKTTISSPFKVGDQQAQLKAIQSAIQSQGVIGPATVGSELSAQIDIAFHSGNLTVGVINITLDSNELYIWARANVWNTTVQASFVFFFSSPTSTNVQLQIEFYYAGPLGEIYSNVFGQSSSDLNALNAASTVDLVLSTWPYHGYQRGLSLSTTTTLANSQSNLYKAFQSLQSNPSGIRLATSLFIPVFDANPTYLTLSLQEQGTFSLTQSVQISSYSLKLAVAQQSQLSLSADATLTLKNQQQPLTFDVSAQWHAQSSVSFVGALSGAWSNPLGLKWLTITSATLTINIGSGSQVSDLKIDALGYSSFASSAKTRLDIDVANNGDYLLSVANVPIADLSAVYSAVAQTAAPSILGQLTPSGTGSFAVSTYNSGNIKRGFSLEADVTVAAGGSLFQAAQVLHSTTSSTTYDLDLFVPIFDQPEDFQFKLVETGSFAVSESVECTSYTINVDVNPTVSISLDAILAVTFKESQQPVTFDVSAQFSNQQGQITFNGALQGKWSDPFGFSWLTINSANLQLVAGGSQTAKVAVTATGAVSFSSQPVSLQINLDATGDFLLSASNIPVKSVDDVFSKVVQKQTPSVLKEVATTATVSFAVATYSSGHIQRGFTLQTQVTVTSGGSLAKAANVLHSTPSSQVYTFRLFISIFDPEPAVQFSLTETGAFAVTTSLQGNSYQISAAVSAQDVQITLSVNLVLTLKSQAQPLNFAAKAQFDEQQAQVSFSGSLQGAWADPLGLEWLTVTSASVQLVIGASVQVDKLSIDASGSLSFSSSPVSLEFSVDGKGDVLLTVSGIPISGIDAVFGAVLEQQPAELQEISTQGTVSLAVATYSSGVAQRGFTLSAQATITEGGNLARAARTMRSGVSSQSYTLKFFAPIFDDPALISLSLTETGAFHLAESIACDSYSIRFAVTTSGATISLATQIAVTVKYQAQPVLFSISGQFQNADSVQFSGSLESAWSQPFGLTWLTIGSASIQLAVSAGAAQSLDISAAGELTLTDTAVQTSLSITAEKDFTEFSCTASVDAQWTLDQVAHALTGRHFSVLNDVAQPSDVQISLTVSTQTGFTFETKGVIQGDLEERVHAISPNSIGKITFEIALTVPIFSTDPEDITLTLMFDDELKITDNFFYEGITFELATMPLAVSVDTEFKALFKKNSPLLFDIDGQVDADGSVLLTGEMIGTWENVFGIEGFSLSDVILEFGVNPSMCEVDFCISDLGLGMIMQMGTRTIQFDGNAAAPDYEDLFLMGAITGSDGMALTVWDIVLEWNRMFPYWAIPEKDVPQDWGLDDTSFYLAPADGTFGNIVYHEGFSFDGGIRLLDMDLHFQIDCGSQVALGCDFNISVDLDKDLFHHMIDKEISLRLGENPGEMFTFFHIDSLGLSEWSAYHYSQGILPRWQIGITVFNRSHKLDFRVEQYELASSFHQFFLKWLVHLF